MNIQEKIEDFGEDVANTLRSYYKQLASGGWVMLLLGVVLTMLLTLVAKDYVDFGNVLIRLGMATVLFWLYDKYILKDYDVIKEIFKKKNTAAAIFAAAIIYFLAQMLSRT